MNDSDVKLYNKGIKEGAKHSEPSPKTLKLMDKISKQVSDNARELKYIIDSQKVLRRRADKNDQCHVDMKENITRIREGQIELKGVVTPIKTIVWVIMGAVLTGLVGGILTLLFR